ncbi:MATE family efflux transporter [Marinicrinis sediminis]|uniref:MATE family efflux transporter n=1 Tax=Marinicrinis sediminis TaxID=1652465 RepID=A0ABW5RGA4_9BACL
MTQDERMDFTQGPLLQKMLWFAWPTFIANLLQASYQFIDSLWIGNLLGKNAIGAVAISAPIIFSVLSFMIGINGATLTVLSQYKGRKDEAGMQKALNAFSFILSLLAIFLGLAGFILTPTLLDWLGTPPDLIADARIYLQIHFAGILFLMGYNYVSTVLRAMGDSKTPVRFVVMAVLLNAVLDPLFIAGFDLGMAGAAYATIVAQGAAFLYGLGFSVKKRNVPFQWPSLPSRQHGMQVLKLGVPGGLQMMAISSGMVAILAVVSRFGSDVVSGFGAASRIESLIMIPAFTMGSVVNSMAGQNVGAQIWSRVHQIARQGAVLIFAVSTTISLLVFLGAEFLIRLFVSDSATIDYGVEYLQLIAFFYPFLGLNFVLNGIARSSGAMLQVLILNLVSFWALRFPLAYGFSLWMGSKGIALGIGISFVLSSLIAAGYYRYGGWQKIKVLDTDKAQT